MQTDDLIAHLSGGLEPVRGTEIVRILAAGLAVGRAGRPAYHAPSTGPTIELPLRFTSLTD